MWNHEPIHKDLAQGSLLMMERNMDASIRAAAHVEF